ncbi:hypothetical protein AGLY_009564 [Aphis glycines]|uniref:Uncharacterized protein n=1 Tax=Aphis glycines TaxID=307491 RepID=A0A6G0THT9_APHGL|nr:hypothetical protein AGLY_009564 [Aphis glycines]
MHKRCVKRWLYNNSGAQTSSRTLPSGYSYSRFTSHYSAKHGFLNCVYTTSKIKCGREEATFIRKIAETLSENKFVSSACQHIEMRHCNTAQQTAYNLFTIIFNTLIIVLSDLIFNTFSMIVTYSVSFIFKFMMVIIINHNNVMRSYYNNIGNNCLLCLEFSFLPSINNPASPYMSDKNNANN